MKNIFVLMCFLLLVGCASNDIEKHPVAVNKYDPSKPQVITGFMPIEGEINDQVIIEGNFGTDVSKMKVLFADNK